MVIHSLNLNEGGGIIPNTDISAPEKTASVIIGIGGTGVDTIKRLKKKIYTQLEPSNPGDPVPRYDMIRLIAIDTDDTAVDAMHSSADIDPSTEFINLRTPALSALLDMNAPAGRPSLRTNPAYNSWMSIDQIQPLLGEAGAGGIRQMGRFMLFQHIQEVYDKIRSSIQGAMTGMDATGQVNVHIIAGISGGTGSGCFLDTCYLTRKVMEENGWGGKVFGYFYLPDVVISKPAVAGDGVKSHLNRRNGYAAFRELDYLMNLDSEHDWFNQTYPGSMKPIHTQKPPVDLCHLISATDAQGNIPKESYNYSLNVVSDYIMAYLAHVELNGALAGSDGGLTMQGHLANIVAGVALIQRNSGANLNYTILGASNAEVPFSQIATYLAEGYYRKVAGISENLPTDLDVNRFAESAGLVYDKLYKDVVKNAPDGNTLALQLKQVDSKDCKGAVITASNMHPKALLAPAQKWYEAFSGRLEENYKGLIKDLKDYGMPDLSSDISYMARIHARLRVICLNQDEKGGVLYASRLLSRTGKDLTNIIEGLITENSKKLDFENNQTQYEENLARQRDEFLNAKIGGSGKWNNYVSGMAIYYEHLAKIDTYMKIDSLLHILKTQLQKLYSEFYQKLDSLSVNLKETFSQNATYLANPDLVRSTNAYTWRIIELDDVKADLDAIIREIVPTTASVDLMSYILDPKNFDEWLSESDFRIGRLINSFMIEKFKEQLEKTVEAYIRDLHPGMQDGAIIQEIQTNILERADRAAEPMFWKAPAYLLNNTTTFTSSTITVPATSTLITAAADNFKTTNPHNYAVRETSIGDRIFGLRFYSGLPLYAYQGTTLMRNDYESDVNGGIAGLHLFEHNTAVESKQVKTEEDMEIIARTAWGTYLPFPIPFSEKEKANEPITEAEKENLAIFNKALSDGVIRKNSGNFYCIYKNNADMAALLQPEENFAGSGNFDYTRADEYKNKLLAVKESWTDSKACSEISLLGSCPVVPGFFDTVLKDTFMRCPSLIDAVKKNNAAFAKLDEEIVRINGLMGAAGKEAELLQKFVDAVVTGVVTQGIGKMIYTYEEYGMPKELRLDTEPADLSPAFILFKAFTGFSALDAGKLDEIAAKANFKLNNLAEGDDAICTKIRTGIKTGLPVISSQIEKLTPDRKTAIMKFYSEIRALLDVFAQQFPGYMPI